MQDKSDARLLREYAERGCEPAFREIVTRHTDLVYSAAVRCVNSPDIACDIAQSVFTDLARKARPLADKLADNASLVGWLYRSTRFAALNHVRDDRRRLAHERQAMEQLLSNSETAPDWDRIRPVLDEAMDNLDDEDRDALLLRYFKNHDFRAVGLALGVSDDTAQKRVSRAVERLREFFAKRGVTVGASGLGVVISANAIQAAPIGLAVTISTAAAVAGTTLATTATATTIKTIVMTTLQKTLIAATLVAAVGAGIYEARQASTLRTQVQALSQQQAPLSEQLQKLQREHDEAASQLTSLRADNERLNRNTGELLKLRDEVTRWSRDMVTSTEPEKDNIQAQWTAWLSQVRTNRVGLEDVYFLIQALTNEAIPVRVEATKALRNIGLQRLLDTNLTSQADSELQLAAKIAAPRLVESLKDTDTFVRANAAITLGFLHQNLEVVVPALVECLHDEQLRVAGSAAKALGRLQGDASSALPALLQTAQSSDTGLRESAINAIKQIDPESARKAGF